MRPTEQRQYFTVAWQAAAKVFTALLQCGKMDPERQAQAEAWENYIGLSHDLLHFDSAKKKKKITRFKRFL